MNKQTKNEVSDKNCQSLFQVPRVHIIGLLFTCDLSLTETKANNSFLCEQCANVPEDLIQTRSGKTSETPNTVLLLKEQLEKKDNELGNLKSISSSLKRRTHTKNESSTMIAMML